MEVEAKITKMQQNPSIFAKFYLYFLAVLFLIATPAVNAEDVIVNCSKGEWTEIGQSGDKGSPNYKNKSGKHSDMSLKITDKECVFDWGNSITDLPLTNVSSDKYSCSWLKDKTKSSDAVRDIMVWDISLNRYSGKLLFRVTTDLETKNGYINNSDYRLTFSCSKAKKLF